MKAPKEKTVEELSTQTDLIRSQLEALQSSTGKEDEKDKEKEEEERRDGIRGNEECLF